MCLECLVIYLEEDNMKTIDYESILCTFFDCDKYSIPLKPAKKAKVIEAMQEAVRQGIEKFIEEDER